jgi:ABC-type amino acid transport substrate-binding protein
MTPEEAIANVASGSVDAAIVDHLTALQLTANHPELSIAGKPLTDEPYVVAGRIAGAELMKHINTALQAMIADGWLKQAQQRWLAQPPPP